jgi:hypothetical protein
MKITLFKAITVEDELLKIEAESATYDGLYVDMEDKDARKYVKDMASSIGKMLKSIERLRIDLSKDYKVEVDKQAVSLKDRLETANKPFTLLIDQWSDERKKVLADKKAKEDAAALAVEIEKTHEEALNMERLRVLEVAEAVRVQAQRDEDIRVEAAREANERANQAEEDAKAVAEAAIANADMLNEARIKQERTDRLEREKAEKQKVIDDKKLDEQREADRVATEKKNKIDADNRVRQATIDAENKVIRDAEAEATERKRREADIEHKSGIDQMALADLIHNDVDEKEAKHIIKLISKGLISHITINY